MTNSIDTQPASESILIVDDENALIQILKFGFEHQGFNVYTAMRGSEAIQIARSNSFQYALLDILLPDISGIQLSLEIKKLLPDVFIILMTGFPGIDSAIEALRQDLYDYLIKPFRFEQVLSVIERARREVQLLGEQRNSMALIESLRRENEQLKQTIAELIPQGSRLGLKPVDQKKLEKIYRESVIDTYTRNIDNEHPKNRKPPK